MQKWISQTTHFTFPWNIRQKWREREKRQNCHYRKNLEKLRHSSEKFSLIKRGEKSEYFESRTHLSVVEKFILSYNRSFPWNDLNMSAYNFVSCSSQQKRHEVVNFLPGDLIYWDKLVGVKLFHFSLVHLWCFYQASWFPAWHVTSFSFPSTMLRSLEIEVERRNTHIHCSYSAYKERTKKENSGIVVNWEKE